MLAFYTDRLSVAPGEDFALHASATRGPCGIEIARVGRERITVLRREGIEIGDHPVPAGADANGCDWPEACRIQVGDWSTGYYDIVLRAPDGATAHHFVCVRPGAGRPRARAALVLATNTYHAYNWWGGANAYCDVTALVEGRDDLDHAMRRPIGVLSAQRPFAPGIVAMAEGAPRLINAGPRGFGAKPKGQKPEFWRGHGYSLFDGSAGFLHKWEHAFVAWAEAEGLAIDYLTDYDVDVDPSALDGYAAMIAVGHSEYWSGRQRDHVERFVDAGGGLAIFSGNTCYWKVRWDDGGRTMACHKWRGLAAEPRAGESLTHLWSHPALGRPEASLTGLTFLYGGYHRLGMCVARGAGAYTVYDDRHWSLEGADLFYGDQIGADVPLIGYENDGCLFTIDADRRLKAVPALGVPENLEIIAIAPAAYGEDLTRGYAPFLPPEDFTAAAEIAFGDASEESIRKLIRGHAVMAAFKRGNGEVFNAGTTEWAHGLAAGDPMVERITRNVLARFGAWRA
jgi:hypothetical protein